MNNMGSADLIIRAKKLKFEAIHLLRQKMVTQLQSTIDQIPRLQNEAFARAIYNIAFFARRHTLFSFMETNKILDEFPADVLIADTERLVVRCAPHPTPEFTTKIKSFLETHPCSFLIQEEHMKAIRKTMQSPSVQLRSKQLQIKIATIMKLPTEELTQLLAAAQLAQSPVHNRAQPSNSGNTSLLAKYTLLQAHVNSIEDEIDIDEKFTLTESAALKEIRKSWDHDNAKKRNHKI
jgi:hypothetical protein